MIINGARLNNKDILEMKLNGSVIYPIDVVQGICYKIDKWGTYPSGTDGGSIIGGGFTISKDSEYVMSSMSGSTYNGRTNNAYLFVDLSEFTKDIKITSKYEAEGSYGGPGKYFIYVQIYKKGSYSTSFYTATVAYATALTSKTQYTTSAIIPKSKIDEAVTKYGEGNVIIRIRMGHTAGYSTVTYPFYYFGIDWIQIEEV